MTTPALDAFRSLCPTYEDTVYRQQREVKVRQRFLVGVLDALEALPDWQEVILEFPMEAGVREPILMVRSTADKDAFRALIKSAASNAPDALLARAIVQRMAATRSDIGNGPNSIEALAQMIPQPFNQHPQTYPAKRVCWDRAQAHRTILALLGTPLVFLSPGVVAAAQAQRLDNALQAPAGPSRPRL